MGRRGAIAGTCNPQCMQQGGKCGRQYSIFTTACLYDTTCTNTLNIFGGSAHHSDIDTLCNNIPMNTPRPSSVAPRTPSSVMVELCNDFVRCASTNRCWRRGQDMMNTQCVSQYCWTSFNVFSIGCQHDPVCAKAITDIGNFTRSAIRYVCRVDSRAVLTWAPSSWGTSGP